MSEHLVFWQGNRNPAISETITIDGQPFDLTNFSVRFKRRPVGSATTDIDQAAIVDNAAAGEVHYSWSGADVDVDGYFLVWWEVTETASGKTQDVGEALIEFRAHAPLTHTYIELESVKSTLSIAGVTGYMDEDLQRAIRAACRGVEKACGDRQFYPGAAGEQRLFTPLTPRLVRIDDLIELDAVDIDTAGDGTYSTSWTVDTDFLLTPANAPAKGEPYTTIVAKWSSWPYGSDWFVRNLDKTGWRGLGANAIRVTGRFGWEATPPGIEQAVLFLVTRYAVRARQAPLGILSVGIDEGAAARLARTDPDVAELIKPYVRGEGAGMGIL
jgi:hypothetical protein